MLIPIPLGLELSLEQVLAPFLVMLPAETLVLDAIAHLIHPSEDCRLRPRPLQADHPHRPLPIEEVTCILVTNHDQLVGIVTPHDLICSLAQDMALESTTISQVMTPKLVTLPIAEAHDLGTLIQTLHQHSLRHLPLTNPDHQVVGLVTATSLQPYLSSVDHLHQSPISLGMMPSVIQAHPTTSLREAAQIMAHHRSSYILITATGKSLLHPLGLLTEGKLLQAIVKQSLSHITPISALMTQKLWTISSQQSLGEANQLMVHHAIQNLVVMNPSGTVCGVLTPPNLLPFAIPNLVDSPRSTTPDHRPSLSSASQQPSELMVLSPSSQPQQLLATQAIEQALQASEYRYYSLSRLAPMGIFRARIDGICAYANPRWFSIVGTSMGDGLGSSWLERVHPDDYAEVAAAWQQAVSAQSPFESEHRIQRPDGSVRWVLTHATPEATLNHRSQHYIGIALDTTERRQQDIARQLQADRQHAIADLSQKALTIRDIDHFLQETTTLIQQLIAVDCCGLLELAPSQTTFSLRAGEGWPQDWLNHSVSNNTPQSQAGFTLLNAPEPVVTEDLRLETRFSSRPFLHNHNLISSISVVVGGQNLPFGVLCVYNQHPTCFTPDDINFLQTVANIMASAIERYQAEAELKQFFDLSPDLFCILAADGTFKRVNSRMEEVFGHPAENLYQKNLSLFIDSDNEADTLAMLASTLKEQPYVEFENHYRYPDGQLRWFAWKTAPTANGDYYVVAREITERKQTEAELQRLNQELEIRVEQRTQELQHANQKLRQEIQERQDAEAALRQSEAMYRLLADTSIDMISQQTLEGQYLYVSPACHRLLGYLPDELLGQSADAFLHPEDLAKIQQNYANGLQQLDIQTITYRIRCKNGTYIWFETTSRLIRDPLGNPLCINAVSRDVTQRQLAEEKLRESQHFIQQITEALPARLYIYDLDEQKTIYTNRELLSDLGFIPTFMPDYVQSMGGNFLNSLVYPADLPRIETHRQCLRDAQDGEIQELEYQIKDANNQWRWHVFHDIVFKRNAQGKATQILGVDTDITQRKRAEAALQRITEAMQHAVEGIAELNLQGHYVSVNRAYAQTCGYEPDEMIGLNWYLTIYPDDLPGLESAYQLMRHQGTVEVETRGVRRDGTTFFQQVTMVLARDEQGHWSGHYCFMKDISDRKHAEKALLDSESAYRTLTQNLPAIVYKIFPNENHRSILFNTRVKTLLGVESAQTTSQDDCPINAIILPKDQAIVAQALQAALKQQQSFRMEYRICDRDGNLRYFLEQGQPVFDTSQQLLHMVGVIFDITERKQAEEDIRRALEQERELNNLKSRFISMTSHEFRTPLAVIASSAGILEDYGEQLSPEKQKKHLQCIQTYVKYTTQLLDDILLIYQADSGRLSSKPLPVDLNEFSQQLIDDLQLTATDHQITLSIQWAPTLPEISAVLCTDEKLLLQVLMNLLSNAIKYSAPGSVIELIITIYETEVEFVVQDRGMGISPNAQSKIFETFYRGENVGNIHGTGLGLSIVQKCLDLLEGRITVSSQLNVGSTFTVTLPQKVCKNDNQSTRLATEGSSRLINNLESQ